MIELRSFISVALVSAMLTLSVSCSKDEVVMSEIIDNYRPATSESSAHCNKVWVNLRRFTALTPLHSPSKLSFA